MAILSKILQHPPFFTYYAQPFNLKLTLTDAFAETCNLSNTFWYTSLCLSNTSAFHFVILTSSHKSIKLLHAPINPSVSAKIDTIIALMEGFFINLY